MTPAETNDSPLPTLNGASRHRSCLRVFIIVFAVALLTRFSIGMLRLAREGAPAALEFPDEQQYWSMAASFHAGSGLRDELGFRATRMPLYPVLLSLVAGVDGGIQIAKAFQWCVGAMMAVCTAALATRLFDRRVGWLAGLFVAFDPFLIFFSSLLLTETLSCTLIAALWWTLAPLIQKGARDFPWLRSIVAGILSALCVYTRESSLGLIGAAMLFLLFFRRFDRTALWGSGIVCILVSAALLPWAIRNHNVIGQGVWLTTRAGISLYDGVGPQADGSSRLGAVKQMPAVRGKSEAAWNQYFLDESTKEIRRNPGLILRLAGTKLLRMWNPLPNVETYQSEAVRLVSAAWMVPVMLLAISGVVILALGGKEAGGAWALYLLIPAGYLTLLHAFFVGSVRYRMPAMPMIEIIAAFGFCAICSHMRRKRNDDHSGRMT